MHKDAVNGVGIVADDDVRRKKADGNVNPTLRSHPSNDNRFYVLVRRISKPESCARIIARLLALSRCSKFFDCMNASGHLGNFHGFWKVAALQPQAPTLDSFDELLRAVKPPNERAGLRMLRNQRVSLLGRKNKITVVARLVSFDHARQTADWRATL